MMRGRRRETMEEGELSTPPTPTPIYDHHHHHQKEEEEEGGGDGDKLGGKLLDKDPEAKLDYRTRKRVQEAKAKARPGKLNITY